MFEPSPKTAGLFLAAEFRGEGITPIGRKAPPPHNINTLVTPPPDLHLTAGDCGRL